MHTIDKRIAVAEQTRVETIGDTRDRDRSRSFDYFLLGALMESATEPAFTQALEIARNATRDLDRIGRV